MTPAALLPRRLLVLGTCAACAIAICLTPTGCSRPLVSEAPLPVEEISDDASGESDVVVVGDLAGPFGMRHFKVESIALVTGLKKTGSDPPQSPQRDILLSEMKRRQVANPNAVLASPRTAMVLVRGFLPPGVRKGDRIDIEIRTPPRSQTTSLEGGWLMPTRLTEMAVLQGRLQTGHDRAAAQGHVLTNALIEGSSDPIALKRGRILGGGIALKSRPLGLGLRSEHKSVRNSSLISAAVNRRFSIFDQANIKQGVATPMRDNYIELEVYPCYRHNLWRYVRVISEIPLRISPQQHIQRMESLRRQLLEPTSASRAALKLEAIGKEAIPILEHGLQSDNQEVRFYTAEALAYLDHGPAAPVLADLAAREPAFRWHALTALSAMDDLTAVDEIVELLHVDSAETRYGAFRALHARSPKDPAIKGETLGDHVALHTVASDGPPMVHFSRSRKAELVIFGDDVRLKTPLVLATDNHLTLKSLDDGQIRVSRFAPGEEDQQIVCSSRLDDVVRQLIKVGATYPDLANVIRMAKQRELLNARVEVDALPRPGRTYHREADDAEQHPNVEVASPLPSLFSNFGGEERDDPPREERDVSPVDAENVASEDDADEPWWNIFGRGRND